MKPVIAGISKLDIKNVEQAISQLQGRTKPIRFVHDLEKLIVGAVGILLDDARIHFPVGTSDISLFIGIDNSIEDIKEEYFNNILDGGAFGASPLLFQFTSPNALTAQVSIAFDIRGESITMPVKYSFSDVLEYTIECIKGKHTNMAIAGGIMLEDDMLFTEKGRYNAEFYFIEDIKSAIERKSRIYEDLTLLYLGS